VISLDAGGAASGKLEVAVGDQLVEAHPADAEQVGDRREVVAGAVGSDHDGGVAAGPVDL